jgi:hypothetical protein
MRTSDYIGFGCAFGFGVWFLAFPRSVIRFYTWFHRGKIAMPRTGGVMIAGAIWVTFVSIGLFVFLRTKQ